MINFVFCTVLLSALILNSQAAKLPPYISQCSKSDPKLSECFIKNGNAAISSIVKGDKKYKVPEMLPLKINKISIDPSNDFHMELRDIKLYGLEGLSVSGAEVDLKANSIRIIANIPIITLIAEYESKGKIINLAIEGRGFSNITMVGCVFDYKVLLDIYQKHGKDYYRLKDSGITYDVERAYYQFDNLFNGNKQLGDEINKFMNDNWREIGEDFRPSVSATIDTIITSIMSAIVKLVPRDEVFAP